MSEACRDSPSTPVLTTLPVSPVRISQRSKMPNTLAAVPTSSNNKRSGKKVLRPWKRLTNRFNPRDAYQSSGRANEEVSEALEEDTLVDAAVKSLRNLTSHARLEPLNDSTGGNNSLPPPVPSLLSRRSADMKREDDSRVVVSQVEYILRELFFLSLCYTLGVYYPQAVSITQKMAEYSLVAWITCLGILMMQTWRRKFGSLTRADINAMPSPSDEQHWADNRYSDGTENETTRLLRHSSVDLEQATGSPHRGYLSTKESMSLQSDFEADILASATAAAHPALEKFFVIDMATGQRIHANTNQAYPLLSEYFEGNILVLIRTPNLDDPSQPNGSPENMECCKYLGGKQRRFEFQFQIKLKKLPKGRVYFACELEETVRMGVVQRAFVSAAMAFVRTTNSSFHYSISGSPFSPDGKYEKPHMAFPVEEGMNRLVATPPDQVPPKLGTEIHEDPESIKRRKKGFPVEWNLQDTYTLALWSAYVDFLEWHACNLPGIRPFDIASIIGRQPVRLTLYDILTDRDSDKHYRSDMVLISEIEMCNQEKSDLGEVSQRWLQVAKGTPITSNDVQEEKARDDDDHDHDDDDDDDLAVDENVDENIKDEDAAAELGEGIYVRSGDIICLRECCTELEGDPNIASCYLTHGGGFAILQDKNASSIIIEKAGQSRSKSKHLSSGLIKSGDAVTIKLVIPGNNTASNDTRYLSLHKGWWLKWVSGAPTKNSFFTIHTNDVSGQGVDSAKESDLSASSESLYLTMDGSFHLRHKRWNKYLVGVAREASPTYGGRMLGLRILKNNNGVGYNTEEDVFVFDGEGPSIEYKTGERWIRSLTLEVCDAPKIVIGTSPQTPLPVAEKESKEDARKFSNEDWKMDVPAWLEIMNRSERVRQLVYVIRVFHSHGQTNYDESQISLSHETFMRLRTGRDLSRVMRVGLAWRNKSVTPRQKKTAPISADLSSSPANAPLPAPRLTSSASSSMMRELARSQSADDAGDLDENRSSRSSDSSDDELTPASTDDLDLNELYEEIGEQIEDSQPSRSKGRQLIGKIAKSVTSKTASTGKKVVRQGVKVGKGTMNAGKAIITGRVRQPPSKEPKSARQRSRRSVERDLHVAVGNRFIKRVERVESKFIDGSDPSDLHVGELSAPEQSCRSVSHMLLRMSSVSPNSSLASQFSSLLASQIEHKSQFDKTFLSGGSVELGVGIPKDFLEKRAVLFDCVVARCIWESHWREEWTCIQKNSVVFYAPLTKDPCLELSFKDMKGVRYVEPGLRTPLPGFTILAIETAWSCHYVAFCNQETRETFRSKLEEALSVYNSGHQAKSEREEELWKARLWQGLQDSLASSLSSGRGKWADVHSNQKMKRRIVLNNRRMVFDLRQPTESVDTFVENLLSTSLSFSLDTLQHHPEAFTDFLDATSLLRGLMLQRLNRSESATFCIFVNLYHCLFQHALLLTPIGPLHKRSCEDFMRTSCYEIGGDVFSLAELSCCIIRGNMARPVSPRPPYIDAPKKSVAYRYFALGHVSPNVNFILNTGDNSCPNEIPVLRPGDCDEQMNLQIAEFIKRNIAVDISKRLVTIPKVCEVYRSDFTSDSANAAFYCLRHCLRYVDETVASKIYALLEDESPITIKYKPLSEQYHTRLLKRSESRAVVPASSSF